MSAPVRCKGCAMFNRGMPKTKYAEWCCAHSLPVKKADPHCRNGHDKMRPK